MNTTVSPTINVSEDKWRDAIKFLMGLGTNPTLTGKDQRILKGLITSNKGMSNEEARYALKRLGWQVRNPHPNEKLTGTLVEWEESVFRNANHFTVFRFFGRGKRQSVVFQTFPEALADARPDERALVYAVTIEGRAVCIPRQHWDAYTEIWGERS